MEPRFYHTKVSVGQMHVDIELKRQISTSITEPRIVMCEWSQDPSSQSLLVRVRPQHHTIRLEMDILPRLCAACTHGFLQPLCLFRPGTGSGFLVPENGCVKARWEG